MKITGVEAYLLSFPLPEPVQLVCSRGHCVLRKRDALLVRVLSDAGVSGYGPAPATQHTKHIIDRLIAPFLTGRKLEDPDNLRILFQQGPGADPETSRIYAAVEIALYDLAGKIIELPVSELIGGRVRDRIRLYGSTGVPLSAEAHVAEALHARELGLTAYKMRLTGDLADDVAAIRAVRNFASADLDIMLDAGGRYSGASAEALAKKLKSCAIRWLENPFEGHEALLELKQLALIPLASGRREPNELRYLDLIDTRAVDYVQMDLVAQGGYATARRLFPDIARAGLRFAFDSFGTALELAAAAHLGACWPESMVRWLEYPLYLTGTRKFLYPFPLAAEILKHPLPVERGSLVVPNGPGLGVDIDESVIWRYPWAPETHQS